MHYIGVPLMREKMAANVRNVTDVEVSDNIIDFLRLMGYQFQVRLFIKLFLLPSPESDPDPPITQFEFIREGVVFQTQKKVTITITQIKKVTYSVFLRYDAHSDHHASRSSIETTRARQNLWLQAPGS